MTDEGIIEQVARLWVSLGGDAEGLTYLWVRIKERIEEKENDR